MQPSFVRFSGFALAAITTMLVAGNANAQLGRRCLDGTIPPSDEDCPDLNGDGLSNQDDESSYDMRCFAAIPECIERCEERKRECFRSEENEYQSCLERVHEIAQDRCRGLEPSSDALDDNGVASIAYWLCIQYQERQISLSYKAVGVDIGNGSRGTCSQLRDTAQLACFDKFYDCRQYECVQEVSCKKN